MTLIVCLDDSRGMMFNHRRQSRDRVLIAELLETVGERRLFVSPYSAPLFPPEAACVIVADDPCVAAQAGDCVFVEDTDPAAAWERVSTLILYHWNRRYPADRYFPADLAGFCKTDEVTFAGSSHDSIRKETWICKK